MLDALWEAEESFARFDLDNSGTIDLAELGGVLTELRAWAMHADMTFTEPQPLDDEYLSSVMSQLDRNGDGLLQFDEYLLFLATPQGLNLLPTAWQASFAAVVAELDISQTLGRRVLYAAQDIFDEADVNDDGVVDRTELQTLLANLLQRLGCVDAATPLSPSRSWGHCETASLDAAIEALPTPQLDFQEFAQLFCSPPFCALLPGGPLAVQQLKMLLGDDDDNDDEAAGEELDFAADAKSTDAADAKAIGAKEAGAIGANTADTKAAVGKAAHGEAAGAMAQVQSKTIESSETDLSIMKLGEEVKADVVSQVNVYEAAKDGDVTLLELVALQTPDRLLEPDESCYGRYPLHWAAAMGQQGAVVLLLSQGAAINQPDNSGYSPLYSAAQAGQQETVQLLLEASALVDQANCQGRTPLLRAAAAGAVGTVQLLLEAGAAIDCRDYLGWTPLFASARNGHEQTVRLLLEAGATVKGKALRWELNRYGEEVRKLVSGNQSSSIVNRSTSVYSQGVTISRSTSGRHKVISETRDKLAVGLVV